MPTTKINGSNLYWEMTGEGEPLVLVHGSWGDHHNWDAVVKQLGRNFQVLTYDRRGHSQSERKQEQGSLEEDAADLIELIENLKLAPTHIAGNSGGAAVVLKTAARHEDLFRTVAVHEPPLFDLLKGTPQAQPYLEAVSSRIGAVIKLIERGEMKEAAKTFVETIAFGPGAWEQLPQQVQNTFVYNAPTFLDETKDPQNLYLDTSRLQRFDKPVLLTQGSQSPPFFPMVLDQLAKAIPQAQRKTIEGAGHVPHLSHPEQYVDLISGFCLAVSEH